MSGRCCERTQGVGETRRWSLGRISAPQCSRNGPKHSVKPYTEQRVDENNELGTLWRPNAVYSPNTINIDLSESKTLSHAGLMKMYTNGKSWQASARRFNPFSTNRLWREISTICQYFVLYAFILLIAFFSRLQFIGFTSSSTNTLFYFAGYVVAIFVLYCSYLTAVILFKSISKLVGEFGYKIVCYQNRLFII